MAWDGTGRFYLLFLFLLVLQRQQAYSKNQPEILEQNLAD